MNLKIPKKKELQELQRKYRSDKKIGEVYGVPARLVAYWRAKKKIGAYSFPKYSEEKIQELWSRFGDDEKAGAELNISRAGFRQWRRRYDINQRPAHLSLEQLELPLPDLSRRKGSRRETMAQKILARKAGLKRVEVGDTVNIEPDFTVCHGCAAEVIQKFQQIGACRIWDPARVAIVLDRHSHDSSCGREPSLKIVRDFAKRHKIKDFFDIGQGISHQLIIENALVSPGQLVFGNDQQSLFYGSIGALASAMTAEEMAVIWASGRIWLRVPETTKVILNGRLSRGVSVKDVVLKIGHGLLPHADYRALEFHGPATGAMSVSERLTLVGAFGDIGYKSASVPFDDTASRYLKKLIKSKFNPVASDPDAPFCDEVEFDIDYLTPQIGLANDGLNAQAVEEVAGRKIDQVVIGCCSNGRIDDLEIAARIMRGRQVARDIRVIIIPASRKVLLDAIDRGYLRVFIDAGCMILNPGCGSCIEAHAQMLEPGEKALSTSNWNCPGRSLAVDSEVFLASPATAAATALEGEITDPRKYTK